MIKDRLAAVSALLPEGVDLVAVSKFHPVSAIIEAYEAGQRVFGENRVQEMVAKYEELKEQCCPDIRWHQIGVLQRNKVKYIAPFVDMIQSISSEALLVEVDRQAEKFDRCIDVLLQVHIAKEETKSGFDQEEILPVVADIVGGRYPHLRLRGLMGMATLSNDESLVRAEFAGLKTLFEVVRKGSLGEDDSFSILSMGMSEDYLIAIEEGANMVRIGSSIFGAR